MRYILNERYYLCGWKKLPFAMMDQFTGRACFFSRQQYEFLFMLSGRKDIDIDALDGDTDKILQEMIRRKIVREAGPGETRNLYYKEYKCIYKSNVQWSITGKCNYCCRHCFQSAPEGVLGEPTLEQCFEIIDQMDRCGIRLVSITGGEPLIRKDFFKIIDELRRHNICVTTLFSNGALIDQELLDGLKQRNMRPAFQISFDGVGYHDWMRGVPGAEEIALNALRLLRDNGFSASAGMCLCRENVGAIRETIRTLAAVGCRGVKLQCSMPQGEWCNQQEHYLTTAETMQAYLDYLPQFKEDGCPISMQMEGFFNYNKERDVYSVVCDKDCSEDELGFRPPCGVIKNSLYIGPNGAVTPCMSMCGAEIEKQFPNLFETPLENILDESSYTELTGKSIGHVLEHNEKCHDCKYRARCCGGCRAMGTGQNGGDYFAIDPIACEMFRDGWIDRLYEEADKLFRRAGQHEEANEC